MKKIKDGLTMLKKKKILIPTVVILVVTLGLLGFFITNGDLGGILGVTSNQNQERQKVISKIEKLIELPKNETPILATVSDITKLSSEDFYQGAMNGDKVLVFKDSKMAVLYRPSKNKIIKVGTVTIQESGPSSTPSGAVAGVSGTNTQEEKRLSVTPTPALVTVAIYNGTKIPGLAKKTSDSLEAKFQNIEIVGTANASGDYSKTLVIDLSGKNKSAAQVLAKELNGEIGSLPQGEARPDADILIIVASE